MVHVPDEDEQAAGKDEEIISVESSPEPDSNRRPTAKNLKAGEGPRRTTNAVGEPGASRRRTQMLSLEPPKRNRTNQIARDSRLDGVGGPSTISQRQRALMGNIGREKTRPVPKGPQGKTTTKPQLRRGDAGKPIDMGGSNKKVMETMIQRRKTTRIIPKDGELQGDTSPLESMKPISSPAAPIVPPRAEGRSPPGNASPSVPPVVKMSVPQPSIPRRRDSAPTPPGARGNTLAGVSAEELLGEEGRALLQQMRRREQDAQRNPTIGQPHRPGTPLGPRMHDSSLVAFQSAEYAAEQAMEEAATDDELAPQGSFLAGPTRQIQREVTQTPMPADDEYGDQPPPDDLGYERAVDYGDVADDSEQNPQARESAAQEEMEQRAGYLLWLQGVITFEEVQEALAAEDDVSDGARELLQQGQFTDQETLYRFLARHETLSPVDLDNIQPSERALAALRPAIARSYRVVPLERVGELLLVAAAWPFDPKRLLELRRLTSSKVKLFIVTEEEIDNALGRYYPQSSGATLRSPPVSDRTDSGDDDIDGITGEGDKLEENYDPTLSGEDSGLYRPISENAYYPSGDIGLSEVDESEFDSHAETGEHIAPPQSGNDTIRDTDQHSELDEAVELDLGGEKKQTPQAGPEDLDPFGE